MGRFIFGQLRLARGRTATFAAGILVAAVSFTLLTSAAATSQLRVKGTVDRNFRGAYDILVRPTGSFTQLERERDLVQQNYLGGIFGGITRRQYEQIKRIPGIEVAAPIANLGYAPLRTEITVPLGHLAGGQRQLFRVRRAWLTNDGLSRYPDTDEYLYYTPNDIVIRMLRPPGDTAADPLLPYMHEVIPGRRAPAMVCAATFPITSISTSTEVSRISSPYDRKSHPDLQCYTGKGSTDQHLPTPGELTARAEADPPFLLAAIDPEQEAKLVGLDRAVSSGRYLRTGERSVLAPPATSEQGDALTPATPQVPVLLSARTYVDQSLELTIERLRVPATDDLPGKLNNDRTWNFLRSLAGRPVERRVIDADTIHEQVIKVYGDPTPNRAVSRRLEKYTQASPVAYRSDGKRLRAVASGRLEDDQYWNRVIELLGIDPSSENQAIGFEQVRALMPPGTEDVRYRKLTHYLGNTLGDAASSGAALNVVGHFDPAKLSGFSELSRLPLETYYPPEAQPADERSRRALAGKPLRPTYNPGGYVAQPPLLLTTLDAADALLDPEAYRSPTPGRSQRDAPISVIRVRVAGVTGADPRSRERIRRVAEAIHQGTGLTVDVTVGSSPQPMLVELPAGQFGQPPLLVREGWVRKGVAVVVLRAIDRKSVALFGLILLTCGLFLANGSLAAVRARRRELGVLRCLGWSSGELFAAVLSELVVVGAAAGLVGVSVAAALAGLLDLRLPAGQPLLVVPVALLLAVLAGLPPACRATLGVPLDAVNPPVLARPRARPVRGLVTMALRNLGRVPGRTLLGVVSLAIGVASLTVLLAINLAFQGMAAGTLLGDLIAVQVRPVDYASVALAIMLGSVSVADVLFLNLRERAAELLTLSTTGWEDHQVRRLGWLEGAGMGLLGSGLGAATGLLVATQLGQGTAGGLVTAALAAATLGLLTVLLAVLIATSFLAKLPPPVILGEE